MLHLIDILSPNPSIVLSCTQISLAKPCESAMVLSKSINCCCFLLVLRVCSCCKCLLKMLCIFAICYEPSIRRLDPHRPFLDFCLPNRWYWVLSSWVGIIFCHLYCVWSNSFSNLLSLLFIEITNRLSIASNFLRLLLYTISAFVWS